MKFLEYVEKAIKEDIEFDAVIGDVDMPATFGFCDSWKITDYCKQKYTDLLNSEVEVHEDPTGHCTPSVVVHYDNDEIGEQFCLAVAGYVDEGEWNMLFMEGDAINE